MGPIVLDLDSPTATESFAAVLAAHLVGGEQIALLGPLGAGKTCFVRGLVVGLSGNRRKVRSPTFTIHHPYADGRLVVDHYDAYFVREADEFARDGVDEQRAAGHVVVIEWADRFPEQCAGSDLEIRFTVTGEESRRLELRGPWLEARPERSAQLRAFMGSANDTCP